MVLVVKGDTLEPKAKPTLNGKKLLSSERLPEYWHFLAPSLIHYIGEIHSLPDNVGITNSQFSILNSQFTPTPPPTK